MKSYYQYANHIVFFDLPKDIDLINLKQHLPGIVSVSCQKEDISIRFIENNVSSVRYDLKQLIISDIWNSSWLSDLPHLLYSYLKYVFFHKNIYFVHSCMIEKTLFIGSSGSGKTTLCLEAINQQLSLSSCDRTCMTFENDILKFISGTDIISVRLEDKQPFLPLIAHNHDRLIYSFDTKSAQQVDSIRFFQINNQLNNQCKEKQIEGLAKVHQLFPFFIDNIKTDCFVQNGKLLFSPIYSDTYKKQLFLSLQNMNNTLCFISGSTKEILDKTHKIY